MMNDLNEDLTPSKIGLVAVVVVRFHTPRGRTGYAILTEYPIPIQVL